MKKEIKFCTQGELAAHLMNEEIYQIYNDRCQLVEQSRWNRQWRLKWRKA